jgi:hypothetical protein
MYLFNLKNMIKFYKKKTNELNNGEMFKFMNEQTNYIVVDWVYYTKVGYSKRKILPFDVYVRTNKTL